jgi:hypothetical protein
MKLVANMTPMIPSACIKNIVPFLVSSPCLPEECDTFSRIYLADFDNEMVTILSCPSGHPRHALYRYRDRP